jgi:polar amino acid transport system substrate-binding protein
LVLALLIVTGGAACAADYSLATGTDYPPYADQKLPDGGLAPQILKQAFAAVGRSVSVTVLPWQRAYALTREGKFDGTFPWVPSPERDQVMLISQPIVMIESRLWSPIDRPLRSLDQEDLKNKRFCVPIGYAPPLAIQGLIDRQIVSVANPPTIASCVLMVGQNHADFLAGDPLVIRTALRDTGVRLFEGDSVAKDRPLRLLATKGGERGAIMLSDFNRGLARLKEEGTYDRLLRPGS